MDKYTISVKDSNSVDSRNTRHIAGRFLFATGEHSQMVTTVSQKQFQDRLMSLISQLSGEEHQRRDARTELSRIFSAGMVDVLEAALMEERCVCAGCDQDHGKSFMSDGVCFDCEIARRIADTAAQTNSPKA